MEVDWLGLRQFVLQHFQLVLETTPHGLDHWNRVESYGAYLARRTEGAQLEVVRLFAQLHDSCRFEEGADPGHGFRACELVGELQGRFFQLSDPDLQLLRLACRDHELGYTTTNPTIGCCWDSDRLDLDRVGITVSPSFLSTKTAMELCFLKAWDRRHRVGRA